MTSMCRTWPQLRYKDTGLLKRCQWEKTWDQQREEDRDRPAAGDPVPPKYKKEDFLRTSYWNQRGKLDVPKERFISYPGRARTATTRCCSAGRAGTTGSRRTR